MDTRLAAGFNNLEMRKHLVLLIQYRGVVKILAEILRRQL